MRFLARAYVVTGIVGAVHAVRRGLPARFAGVRLPGSPLQHAVTLGTPLSAPPLAWLAVLLAEGRGRNDIVRKLALLFVVGIAGEPDTWSTLRRPAEDPTATALVALDLVLPMLMIRGKPRSVGSSVTV